MDIPKLKEESDELERFLTQIHDIEAYLIRRYTDVNYELSQQAVAEAGREEEVETF